MYCSASPAVKNAIAALLFTKLPRISLKFIDVQMQSGGRDCGLFAITFATALCLGKQPGQFSFNQELMHETTSAEVLGDTRNINVSDSKGKTKQMPYQRCSLICICRLPALSNTNMIQCTSCKEWYHVGACVSVSCKVLSDAKARWNYPSC